MPRLRAAVHWGLGLTLGLSATALAVGLRISDVSIDSDKFWSHFHPEAVEVNHFNSLEEIEAASDLVVRGHIEAVRLSRQWNAVPAWGPDGIVTFVMATIAVDDVLKGSQTSDVSVELFLADAAALPEVLAEPAGEDAVFFLQRKADVKGAYALSSMQGYLRNAGVAVPPVASAEDAWLQELGKINFEQLVARLSGSG